MIAFHWLDEECVPVPTLIIDTLLDCFFILDILVNFNLAILREGEVVDDRRTITREYLKGSFTFDLFTSFPVSFFELHVQMQCDKNAEDGSSGACLHTRGKCMCADERLMHASKMSEHGQEIAFCVRVVVR
jgi:hypothetical protein